MEKGYQGYSGLFEKCTGQPIQTNNPNNLLSVPLTFRTWDPLGQTPRHTDYPTRYHTQGHDYTLWRSHGGCQVIESPPPNNTQKQLWGTETQVNSLHFSRAFQRVILGSQWVEGLLRLSDPKWISVPSQVRKKVFFFLRPDLYLKLTLGHSNSINHQSV